MSPIHDPLGLNRAHGIPLFVSMLFAEARGREAAKRRWAEARARAGAMQGRNGVGLLTTFELVAETTSKPA